MSKLIESRWLSWLIVAALIVASVVLVWSVAEAAADHERDAWSQVRECESGNNYAINTGNGYYGAYQFHQPTWDGVIVRAGHPQWAGRRASDAPPHVQDEAAEQLRQERGTQPWPVCGRLYNGSLPQPNHRPKPLSLDKLRFGGRSPHRFLCSSRGRTFVVAVRATPRVAQWRWRVAEITDSRRDPGRADRVFRYGRVESDAPRVGRPLGRNGGCYPGVIRDGRLWRLSWSGGPAQLVR